MNWRRLVASLFLICVHLGSLVAEYERPKFCERLRLAVVNFVGDDFDVYNKLLFEHSVFIYKKLCLYQNVSAAGHPFLNDMLENAENEDDYDYVTKPWNSLPRRPDPALGPRDPAAMLNNKDPWFLQQQPHWFEKEL
ncbi:uncharacterized protein LOC103505499 isoform X1 [Diaphorina citri]|uniref:Uncharacterized protein LOC103505499 isoform X1 n=1 Tax=Diaphorina citri TaxID=121845 RepID=A0A1S3CUF1_DIACI|nr:uncharacterized protein LOC103505499 isoform X1 [Diaphorina citri]